MENLKIMSLDHFKQTELHVHLGGCLSWQDFLELSKDHYKTIDWTLYDESYNQAYGNHPNLTVLIKNALTGKEKALVEFKQLYIYGETDGGDFNKFQAKFNLLICLFRHYVKLNSYQDVIRKIVQTHKKEGIKYIEYRVLYPIHNKIEAIRFHLMHCQVFQEESNSGFSAKYIPGTPRNEPVRGLALVQKLMLENHCFFIRKKEYVFNSEIHK
jgi:hypothetical protein